MLGADLKQSGGKFARAQAEVFSAAGLKQLLKQGLLPSERRGFSGGIHLNKSAKLFWLWMLSQSDTPEPPQVPAILRMQGLRREKIRCKKEPASRSSVAR